MARFARLRNSGLRTIARPASLPPTGENRRRDLLGDLDIGVVEHGDHARLDHLIQDFAHSRRTHG